MFEQAVGHLLEHHAHVFVGNFLGDDVKRHGGKARMQRPHHPRQHSAVTDPGIEQSQRRRRWLQIAEFERNPVGDLGLFAAGRDEQQIFLAVVEEAEARRRDARPGGGVLGRRRWDGLQLGRPGRMREEKGAHLVERFGRDVGAVAQPRNELAVIDGEPAEGGFRSLGGAAIIPDLAQNLAGGDRSVLRSPARMFAVVLVQPFASQLVVGPAFLGPHGSCLPAAFIPERHQGTGG